MIAKFVILSLIANTRFWVSIGLLAMIAGLRTYESLGKNDWTWSGLIVVGRCFADDA